MEKNSINNQKRSDDSELKILKEKIDNYEKANIILMKENTNLKVRVSDFEKNENNSDKTLIAELQNLNTYLKQRISVLEMSISDIKSLIEKSNSNDCKFFMDSNKGKYSKNNS